MIQNVKTFNNHRVGSLLVPIVLMAGTGCSRADQKKEAKNELEGTWTPIALEFNGEKSKVSEQVLKTTWWKFTGDKLIVKNLGGELGDGKETERTCLFDKTKDPKRIDVKLPSEEKEQMVGIYKIEEDKLTICWVEPSNLERPMRPGATDRPTKFETTEGSEHTLMVFKRKP